MCHKRFWRDWLRMFNRAEVKEWLEEIYAIGKTYPLPKPVQNQVNTEYMNSPYRMMHLSNSIARNFAMAMSHIEALELEIAQFKVAENIKKCPLPTEPNSQ